MFDWNRMMKTAARGHGFAGRTRAEEDAYFAAFADDPRPIPSSEPERMRISDLLDLLRKRPVS